MSFRSWNLHQVTTGRTQAVTQLFIMWFGFTLFLAIFVYSFFVLRDAIEKLFHEVVQQRKAEIQANTKIARSLLAFQR